MNLANYLSLGIFSRQISQETRKSNTKQASLHSYYRYNTSSSSLRLILIPPPNANPLISWPITSIHCSASPFSINGIVHTLPAAVFVDWSSMDIPSIGKALIWNTKWNAGPCSFGWVVDPLELVVDKVAVGSSHKDAVPAEAL